MKARKFNRLKRFVTGAALILALAVAIAEAGDVDVRLTTTNGSTKFSIQDSASIEVSSVNSDGNAYFTSLTQTGASGGNVILNTDTPQSGFEISVTSATFSSEASIGATKIVGNSGANTENYLSVVLTAGAALASKQVVIMQTAGTVNTTTTASSNTVVGVTVSATSAGSQPIRVAIAGVVTGVTCSVALQAGVRVCTATSAGTVGRCGSATNDSMGVGKMLSSCAASGTGTLLLWTH